MSTPTNCPSTPEVEESEARRTKRQKVDSCWDFGCNPTAQDYLRLAKKNITQSIGRGRLQALRSLQNQVQEPTALEVICVLFMGSTTSIIKVDEDDVVYRLGRYIENGEGIFSSWMDEDGEFLKSAIKSHTVYELGIDEDCPYQPDGIITVMKELGFVDPNVIDMATYKYEYILSHVIFESFKWNPAGVDKIDLSQLC